MAAPLFLFDFDQTLYAYDFRRRLPALARLTGATQYHLASTWWAGGYEAAAEGGEFETTEEYLAAFAEVTGAALTREQWIEARREAMSPIPGAIRALESAATLGAVSLLSNNPIVFRDCLPDLAPDVAAILGPNDLVSAVLGARKPERRIYTRALGSFGVASAHAMLVDDSAANIAGAVEAGLAGFLFDRDDAARGPVALDAEIRAFAARVAGE
ncbi:HAD family phosphatase [Agromyces protaetiae]|uniref:HAD family phosphatase n=1 Tax=Agromyces protaetiae TaxID=2509455 RepID=A0A4P6FH37_9MICO|nr:HAD-IA family hydrolase [Agromyces protaetiae]QAY74473.1 HAD family phosphatase [Agromyces protaetiae]